MRASKKFDILRKSWLGPHIKGFGLLVNLKQLYPVKNYRIELFKVFKILYALPYGTK